MTSAGTVHPRQQVLEVLREHLLRPGAVTGGFHGLDVVDHSPSAGGQPAGGVPPGVAVLFRWRADPTTYAFMLPVTLDDAGAITQLEGPHGWPGYPMTSAQVLADEADFLLMEELDTGFVRRARRLRRGPVVYLLTGAAPDVMPAGFFVGPVHVLEGHGQDEDGEDLGRAGLDVRAVQQASAEQQLVTWLDAYVNNSRGEPVVGHVAVAWEAGSLLGPGGSVRVVALQVLPGWPVSVGQALLFNALRDAAEAGALVAVAGPDVARQWREALREAGFTRAAEGGEWVLPLEDQCWPDLSV